MGLTRSFTDAASSRVRSADVDETEGTEDEKVDDEENDEENEEEVDEDEDDEVDANNDDLGAGIRTSSSSSLYSRMRMPPLDDFMDAFDLGSSQMRTPPPDDFVDAFDGSLAEIMVGLMVENRTFFSSSSSVSIFSTSDTAATFLAPRRLRTRCTLRQDSFSSFVNPGSV